MSRIFHCEKCNCDARDLTDCETQVPCAICKNAVRLCYVGNQERITIPRAELEELLAKIDAELHGASMVRDQEIELDEAATKLKEKYLGGGK